MLLDPMNIATKCQSESFKVVVNLEYTEKQYKEGVGKIQIECEEAGGSENNKV